MRHAWTILCKDLRQRMRDRSAWLIAVVTPLVLASLIGISLGRDRSLSVRVGLVAGGDAAGDARLAAHLRREWLAGVAAITALPSLDAARRAIDAGALDVALAAPAAGERAAAVEVLVDARNAAAAQLARGLAEAFARGADPERPRLVRDAAPVIRVSDYFICSMSVLFLTFAVLSGVQAFQVEQQAGTLARMRATPASPHAILAGKFGALVVVGLVQMAVMIGFSSLALGTRWGAPHAVAALVFTTVLYAVGLTSFVMSVAGDAERGRILATVLIFLLAVIGGQFLPPQGLPEVFDTFARFTPNGQAFRGFADLAAARGEHALASVREPLLVTAGTGLAGIGYGALRARRALTGGA